MDNINLEKIEGYMVQLVADGVWAIDEFGVDIIYLVAGEKRAAVIDTGGGFGNLKAVIERLTDLPYIVLNTHGHIDHAGGNSDFDAVYLSEKDFFMAEPDYMKKEWDHFADRTVKEPDFYGMGYMKKKHAFDDYEMRPLSEHQVFDLGGRSLEALFTPGDTLGSAVFLDRENKLLFSGDSIVSTPILIFDDHAGDVRSFGNALKRLENEDFELIFPGHYLRPVGRNVLHDLILCAEQITEGTANPEPADFSHLFPGPAVIYRFGKGCIAYNDKHITAVK